jgi:hypothetical protein
MLDSVPADSAGAQPIAIFRRELGTAAARERARKVLRADKKAALASLADDDLGRLIAAFDTLLCGPSDVTALAEELHATLRALSPETAPEEAPHA